MGISYSSSIYKPPHLSDVNYLTSNINDNISNISENRVNKGIYVRSLVTNNVSNNKLKYINTFIKNKHFDIIIMLIPYKKSLVSYKEFCTILASMGVIIIVCKFNDETIYDSNQYVNHDIVINILNDIINDVKQNLLINNFINPSFNTITLLFHSINSPIFFKLVDIINNPIISFVFIDSVQSTNTEYNKRIISLNTSDILKQNILKQNILKDEGKIKKDIEFIYSNNISSDINRLNVITSYIEIIAERIINFIKMK